jgi:hypothetical protein
VGWASKFGDVIARKHLLHIYLCILGGQAHGKAGVHDTSTSKQSDDVSTGTCMSRDSGLLTALLGATGREARAGDLGELAAVAILLDTENIYVAEATNSRNGAQFIANCLVWTQHTSSNPDQRIAADLKLCTRA